MVMNITDIDDKIIIRSKERGITAEELARMYEAEFLADMVYCYYSYYYSLNVFIEF